MLKSTLCAAFGAATLLLTGTTIPVVMPSGIFGSAMADEPSALFSQGLEDRTGWENWFSSLSGDERAGAEYWAGQRSLPNPGNCLGTTDFTKGCMKARARLAGPDTLRKSQPAYRQGWNAYVATAMPAPGPPSVSPAPVQPTLDMVQQQIATAQLEKAQADAAWAKARAEKAEVEAEREKAEAIENANKGTQPATSSPPPVLPPAVTAANTGVNRPSAEPPAVMPAPSPPPVVPTLEKAANTPPPQPAAVGPATMPDKEKKFITMIDEFVERYNSSPNEMAQGGLRPQRAKAVCDLLGDGEVIDWVGTVQLLSSNGEGKGVLDVSLNEDINVMTWNNSLSDFDDKTLITPGTPLHDAAVKLSRDQRIVFSGTFVKGDEDCFREGSITQSGSMTDPDWIFRFSAVRPAG